MHHLKYVTVVLSTVYVTELGKTRSSCMFLQNVASVIISFCGCKLKQITLFYKERKNRALTTINDLIREGFQNFLVMIIYCCFRKLKQL